MSCLWFVCGWFAIFWKIHMAFLPENLVKNRNTMSFAEKDVLRKVPDDIAGGLFHICFHKKKEVLLLHNLYYNQKKLFS